MAVSFFDLYAPRLTTGDEKALLQAYPKLTREDIHAALRYVA